MVGNPAFMRREGGGPDGPRRKERVLTGQTPEEGERAHSERDVEITEGSQDGGETSRDRALQNQNGLLQRTVNFSAREGLGAARVSPHRAPYRGRAGGGMGWGR